MVRMCARFGAPIADMRTQFSRMPRRARPNGEWISRGVPGNSTKNKDKPGKPITLGRGGEEIEIEGPKQPPGMDTLQAVDAAGQPTGAVRKLGQQQAEAERQNYQREVTDGRNDA